MISPACVRGTRRALLTAQRTKARDDAKYSPRAVHDAPKIPLCRQDRPAVQGGDEGASSIEWRSRPREHSCNWRARRRPRNWYVCAVGRQRPQKAGGVKPRGGRFHRCLTRRGPTVLPLFTRQPAPTTKREPRLALCEGEEAGEGRAGDSEAEPNALAAAAALGEDFDGEARGGMPPPFGLPPLLPRVDRVAAAASAARCGPLPPLPYALPPLTNVNERWARLCLPVDWSLFHNNGGSAEEVTDAEAQQQGQGEHDPAVGPSDFPPPPSELLLPPPLHQEQWAPSTPRTLREPREPSPLGLGLGARPIEGGSRGTGVELGFSGPGTGAAAAAAVLRRAETRGEGLMGTADWAGRDG